MRYIKSDLIFLMVVITSFTCCTPSFQQDPKTVSVDSISEAMNLLPSWNEGKTRQAIIDFVTKTTTVGSSDFIPEADRIAVFDNDGTLWAEQPMYFQLFFAIDRIKAMAPEHPEWKTKQPYKALMEGDIKSALAGGEQAILEIIMTSHAGMSSEQFQKTVADWFMSARHPDTGKYFHEMIYQPMIELLEYLRRNNYKTFIVSGGGVDFMRVWTEQAYGIPPYQVVGSSIKVKYEIGEGNIPRLIKQPQLNFIDDKDGKPIGIHQYIGKRPVFAAGNSDGDYQMLQWTTRGQDYPRFGLFVHHTDAQREWKYDRDSHIGHLDKGLDDAEKYNWIIADIKNDWKIIFPFELTQ